MADLFSRSLRANGNTQYVALGSRDFLIADKENLQPVLKLLVFSLAASVHKPQEVRLEWHQVKTTPLSPARLSCLN